MKKKELLEIQAAERHARRSRNHMLDTIARLKKYESILSVSDVYTLLRGEDSDGITKVMLKIKEFTDNKQKEEK